MNRDIPPIVWIIHPRTFQDIEREIPMMRRLPSFLKLFVPMCVSPYKVSSFNENGQIRGFIVAVPLLPVHFQRYKSFSAFRLGQAFKLAKKLGADKVSVGGMITTLAEKSGLGKKYGLEIFDGTDLLAQVAAQKVSRLIKEQRTQIKSVGIIGATTKTGSLLSKHLSTEPIDELHLFAKTAANVHALADECRKTSAAKIYEHIDLKMVGECDICILTAFIPETRDDVIANLKHNSIFLSIIEPASPFVNDIERSRPDVRLTKGINIKAPLLSYAGLDFVIHSGNVFSCLAEALVADTGKSNRSADVEEILRANNLQIA